MIMLCPQNGQTVSIDKIKSQTVIRPTHGLLSLKTYYEKVSKIDPATWLLIKAAFSNEDWYKMLPASFRIKYPEVSNALDKTK